MTAFYISGGILAVWALLVSLLGVTRADFPASKGSERAVAAISVVLVLCAVSAAIVGSMSEEEGGHEEHEAAIVHVA